MEKQKIKIKLRKRTYATAYYADGTTELLPVIEEKCQQPIPGTIEAINWNLTSDIKWNDGCATP